MRGPSATNLALRLGTAGVLAPLIIYLLYWGPAWGFVTLAAIICALGAAELFRMVAPRQVVVTAWGVAASLCVFGCFALVPETRVLGLVVVGLVCGGMLVALAVPEPIETAAQRMGWALAGPLYVGGLFGTVVATFAEGRRSSWVILALLCGFLSDTAGYFVGSRWGKRPFYPKVSPKKTWEGAFAGLAAGLASGLFAHAFLLRDLALVPAIVLSLVATAAGQAGDLCESLIKRSTGLKDSGDILPGHGGILDRSDAMLFASATVYTYLVLFGGSI
jgi:phosphatidate cytidylyltransferase